LQDGCGNFSTGWAITVAYNRHEKFEALKQENESFRQSMLAVCDVLKGI
jgi:hypothetical protein